MKIEIREIKGTKYFGRIYASSNGLIFVEQPLPKLAGDIQRLVELHQTMMVTGYHVVVKTEDRKVLYLKVARLLLLAFEGYRTDDFETCHKDGDLNNLNLDNLKWKLRTIDLSGDIDKLGVFKEYNEIIMTQQAWQSRIYNRELFDAYVKNISTLHSDSLKREFFLKYFENTKNTK